MHISPHTRPPEEKVHSEHDTLRTVWMRCLRHSPGLQGRRSVRSGVLRLSELMQPHGNTGARHGDPKGPKEFVRKMREKGGMEGWRDEGMEGWRDQSYVRQEKPRRMMEGEKEEEDEIKLR
ncbi:hypothetical protein EYF80_029322 [Liparis tanakae]|uniref:Uncharacterized protein n=1 Tax=Liparis tanakae TaxID=230148 RepID=A0A4Z2H4C4_9TELE|nr:hypothetical protein EYF80_029322 [Liparis tanakae]